jgi:hypothetical protein
VTTTLLSRGLAIGVVGITILSVALGRVEPVAVLLVAGATAVSAVFLGLTLAGRNRMTKTLGRIRSIEPVAVPETPRFPNRLVKRAAEIRSLGFTVAGATDTPVYSTPPRTWVLVEPSGETWVEMGFGIRPMTFFISEVAGGRVIETCYPVGQPIDDPRLLSQVVTSSGAAALERHRAAVTDAGGATLRVTSLEDYLAAEHDHRRRTGGMRIESYLVRVTRPSIRDWGIGLVVELISLGVLVVVFAAASSGG